MTDILLGAHNKLTRFYTMWSTRIHVFFCIIPQELTEVLSPAKCLGSLSTSWFNRKRAMILSVACSHSSVIKEGK